MSSRMRRVVSCVAVVLMLAAVCTTQAQPGGERIGTTRQPLVAGTLVDAEARFKYRLLTLRSPGGTCSASLLNDYWAITAAHCVFSSTPPCSQFAPNQVTLEAAWPGNNTTARARRIVTYGSPAACPMSTLGVPNDVALVQVGPRDFVRLDGYARKLDSDSRVGIAVTAFGRGISGLASGSGAMASPVFRDGLYRSAEFGTVDVTTTEFSFMGGRGATIAGGDSGGPSLAQDWDNPSSPRRRLEWRLIGVHSRCETKCLSGKTCSAPNPWNWVEEVTKCWDADILPIHNQILAEIDNVPTDEAYVGQFPSVPPEVIARRRAMYAISIDEPLIAPEGAAIDVPLTFENCHYHLVNQGCPAGPVYEQWSYNPQTHQLLHVESGRCLNISGARHDAGAPIILYACSGAPNEKWSLISTPGVGPWVVRSDLTGMCLHAMPGRSSGGVIGAARIPVAKLVQMHCDGSNAQKFSGVDADWDRRHGPG